MMIGYPRLFFLPYSSQATPRISKLSPIFVILIVSLKHRKCLRINGLRSLL